METLCGAPWSCFKSIYLREKFPADGERSTNGLIRGSFSKQTKKALNDPSTIDKNFRFYVKKEQFQLLDFPG